MKHILEGHDEQVAEWVSKHIDGFVYGYSPYTSIGLVNETGDLIAGVLYENFTKTDIHMHIASTGEMTPEFIGEAFRYPFYQLGCVRITGTVPSKNVVARKFARAMGFKHEGTLRRMMPNGDDLLVYGMLRDECPWLKVGIGNGIKHPVTQYDGLDHVRTTQ